MTKGEPKYQLNASVGVCHPGAVAGDGRDGPEVSENVESNRDAQGSVD